MRINNNVMAINSHRMYGVNSGSVSKDMEKLSSGYRVNRAGDDAAGLAISEKMRTQIRGLSMASKNSLDGVSLVQTAEGALARMQDMMQRIRELAVQGANGTNEQLDRDAIALEVWQISREIGDMDRTVQFNGMCIFDTRSDAAKEAAGVTNLGSLRDITLQVGANEGDILKIAFNFANTQRLPPYDPDINSFTRMLQSGLNHVALALEGGYGTNSRTIGGSAFNYSGISYNDLVASGAWDNAKWGDHAPSIGTGGPFGPPGVGPDGELKDQNWWIGYMISATSNYIDYVSELRADLGAMQNRLEFKIMNLDNSAENLAASESRIRDADMAKMMTDFTKNNILYQSSTAMLAQANAVPQAVLSLLS